MDHVPQDVQQCRMHFLNPMNTERRDSQTIFGDVFRARDTKVGRTVAVKIVSPDIAGDSQRRAKFLNDAAPLTALNHPNIANVYEIGEDRDESHGEGAFQ